MHPYRIEKYIKLENYQPTYNLEINEKSVLLMNGIIMIMFINIQLVQIKIYYIIYSLP
jgi:hypothetical protein